MCLCVVQHMHNSTVRSVGKNPSKALQSLLIAAWVGQVWWCNRSFLNCMGSIVGLDSPWGSVWFQQINLAFSLMQRHLSFQAVSVISGSPLDSLHGWLATELHSPDNSSERKQHRSLSIRMRYDSRRAVCQEEKVTSSDEFLKQSPWLRESCGACGLKKTTTNFWQERR